VWIILSLLCNSIVIKYETILISNFKIMKYLLWSIALFFIFLNSVFALDIEDNQIQNALAEKETKELQTDFRLQSFNSCQDMEDVMQDYLKEYFENQSQYSFRWGFGIEPFAIDAISEDFAGAVAESADESTVSSKAVTLQADWLWWGASDDFSETNTQVAWVDEADIVKTDGTRSYYYNATQKAVYVLEWETVVKKINIPQNMYGVELYIANNKLVIITTGYSDSSSSKKSYYFDRNSKTFTIVYDVENPSTPRLEKLYMSDGNYTQSRRIGDLVYVLSSNYVNFPYYNYNKEDDLEISVSEMVPRKLEITFTDDTTEQNLSVNGKKFPYSVEAWNAAACNEIEYVLPDADTLEKYNFTPSYNIISVIDIKNTEADVETSVIAWSNNEVYMSLDNLYLTSRMYVNYDFSCPAWGSCFLPFYHRWENTLLHKLNINGKSLDYDTSTIITWNPLTQYSMDEHDWYFRIITQNYYPERSSSLYILDEDLQLTGQITGLGKTEDFKSSRFIEDKLFLVTFQQVDPLFAIDVSNPANPEVLWELKIPWYSTYLHPYDENHLIGLGYGTEETEWGGVRNTGVKLDVYEINYDKQCGDANLTTDEQEKCDSWDYKWIIVKQKFTKTLWDQGSYSEALHNPRMFIWNSSKELLFLPVQLYKTDTTNNSYRRLDFFQWVSVLNINADAGISEKGRISHIDTTDAEEKRQEACERYSNIPEEPVCRELIGWGEYCGGEEEYNYVPPYCYADSSIWEYIANQSWNYNNSFIKRALYIGNNILSFSDEQLQYHDINSLQNTGSVFMK
jgi:inhibitor of cysteine peptidase